MTCNKIIIKVNYNNPKDRVKKENKEMKNYNYEWKTVNDIISNLDTKVIFKEWDNEVVTLREIFR